MYSGLITWFKKKPLVLTINKIHYKFIKNSSSVQAIQILSGFFFLLYNLNMKIHIILKQKLLCKTTLKWLFLVALDVTTAFPFFQHCTFC